MNVEFDQRNDISNLSNKLDDNTQVMNSQINDTLGMVPAAPYENMVA